MRDIVERLRTYDKSPRLWNARCFDVSEAADEIERLMRVLQEIAEDRPQSHPIDIARRALEGTPDPRLRREGRGQE